MSDIKECDYCTKEAKKECYYCGLDVCDDHYKIIDGKNVCYKCE